MSGIIATAFLALSKAVTPNEALSGIFGSVSLATWIFLLVGLYWSRWQEFGLNE
jgi:hypothetical protein